MPEGPKEKGMMPGEKDPTEHPHHPGVEMPPGGFPGERREMRFFATAAEYADALRAGGISGDLQREIGEAVSRFRQALEKGLEKKARGILEGVKGRIEKTPALARVAGLMNEELKGKVGVGEASRLDEMVEEGEARVKGDLKFDKTVSPAKDAEGVLIEPRPQWLTDLIKGERYTIQIDEPRSLEEVERGYLGFLASIRTRQPVPGQGINFWEWKEIVLYHAELDAVIKTTEDPEVKEEAIGLKRFANAYVHELEYYHRFWYGEEAGIGKEADKCKEGSRMLLIDQWVPLLSHPKVAEAFKKMTGYESDAQLIRFIESGEDPDGIYILASHLRRYCLTPMFRDAYMAGVRVDRVAWEHTWDERVMSVVDWNRQLRRIILEFEREDPARALTDEQNKAVEEVEWSAYQAELKFRERLTDILNQELPPGLRTPERLRRISYRFDQGIEGIINALRFDKRERAVTLSEKDLDKLLETELNVILLELRDEFGPVFGRGQRKRIVKEILNRTKEERRALREQNWAYQEVLIKALLEFDESLLEQDERETRRLIQGETPIKFVRFVVRAPEFGKSYEYSIFGDFFLTAWGLAINPDTAAVLIYPDVFRPEEDLGEMGAFDMFTSPARLALYLRHFDSLGEWNQIRLTADRDWLTAHPEEFLPRETSEEWRDLLWKAQEHPEMLTRAERERLKPSFSRAEIRTLQEIVEKGFENQRLNRAEKALKEEFVSVALRNMLNRDLGIDPSELDLVKIFSDPMIFNEKLMPNDMLTNLLVEVRRMEQTKKDLVSSEKEAFIVNQTFERINFLNAHRFAHLGVEELRWLKKRRINALREIVTGLEAFGVVDFIENVPSAIFKEKAAEQYRYIKMKVREGFEAKALEEIYGIDFTDPALARGSSLQQTIEKLLQVQGMANLIRIYEGTNEAWVIDVLENDILASPIHQYHFMRKFRFNSYESFAARIIEEPMLNFAGYVGRGAPERRMKERPRGRLLWLAKRGGLEKNAGIYLKSHQQELRINEKIGGRRREGGRWIEGHWHEIDKVEKVGFVFKTKEGREVFYRTIAWEDPIQRVLYEIEQLIYDRNYRFLSAEIDNNSPDETRDPMKWLTPPEIQAEIYAWHADIRVNDDLRDKLLKQYEVRDSDLWRWTRKRYVFGTLAPQVVQKIPIIGQLVSSVNLAGLSLSIPAVAAATTAAIVAGLAFAPALTVGSLAGSLFWAFGGGPLSRRIARQPPIESFKTTPIIGRVVRRMNKYLPLYWRSGRLGRDVYVQM